MKVTRTKLSNGLKTVIIEMPDSQAVSTSLFVGAGGRYEKPEISGLSHFLEHMAFKGTKKFPSSLTFNSLIESVGGRQNAWTDMDHTNYYNVVPKAHRKMGFEVIYEQIKNPLIPEEEINKERGVIIEEINMRNDNPAVLVWDKLGGLLWPNQPLGEDLIGTKENIKSFQRKDFVDYRNKYYKTENMALAVAGGIRTEEVRPELEGFFGKLESGERLEPEPIFENQKESRVNAIFKETDQANLILAYKTFSIHDPRKVALDLLSVIIGGGFGSILFREIREKLGLAYHAETHLEYFADTGFIAAYAGLNKDKVASAASKIKEELFKTKDMKFRVEDVARAKEYLKGFYQVQLETSSSLSNWFGKRELISPENPEPKDLVGLIDKVTDDELRSVANGIFTETKESMLVVGPYKEKDKFEKALKK
jgi:predicted Zn-dependent peptidase